MTKKKKEKNLTPITFYGIMIIVVLLFSWLMYTQSDVELDSATDTKVRHFLRIRQTVAFVKEDAKLGKYLADANGMALYTYKKDAPGVSNCTGECKTAWPAHIVNDNLLKTDGVATGAVSYMKLDRKAFHVTYNGMPLYRYLGDVKPGDVLGEGKGAAAGDWTLARP